MELLLYTIFPLSMHIFIVIAIREIFEIRIGDARTGAGCGTEGAWGTEEGTLTATVREMAFREIRNRFVYINFYTGLVC